MGRRYSVLLGVLAITAAPLSVSLLFGASLWLVPVPFLIATLLAVALTPLFGPGKVGDADHPVDVLIGISLAFAVWTLAAAGMTVLVILSLSLLWTAAATIPRHATRWHTPERWFRAASMWASALAGAVLEWGVRDAYFALTDMPHSASGQVVRVADVPFLATDSGQVLAHANFHALSDAGLIISGGILLLAFAWGSLRHGIPLAPLLLFASGVPLAVLPLLAAQVYGYAHDTLVFGALWLFSTTGAFVGTVLKHRQMDRAASGRLEHTDQLGPGHPSRSL